jgi:hypothetical protein
VVDDTDDDDPSGELGTGKIVELRPGKGKRRRPSTIDLLPRDVRDSLNEAIADGRMSVDDLWALVKDKGGDAISRSAVGRYKVREERQHAALRKMQQSAEVWTKEASKDPNGSVARLLAELMKSVAFNRLMSMTDREMEKVDPKDLNFLAGAITKIMSADKMSAEREVMIRDRAAKAERARQEAALKSAERKGQIDSELAQRARQIMFGR